MMTFDKSCFCRLGTPSAWSAPTARRSCPRAATQEIRTCSARRTSSGELIWSGFIKSLHKNLAKKLKDEKIYSSNIHLILKCHLDRILPVCTLPHISLPNWTLSFSLSNATTPTISNSRSFGPKCGGCGTGIFPADIIRRAQVGLQFKRISRPNRGQFLELTDCRFRHATFSGRAVKLPFHSKFNQV